MHRRWSKRLVSALLGGLLVVVGLVAVAPSATAAASLPAGFVLRDQPSGQAAYDLTDFAYLPDGSILTIGKSGKLAWVSPSGATRTLHTFQVRTDGDLGLVGLAVAPDYATSHQIYLARTIPASGGGTFRLARFTVTGSPEPTGVDTETVLLDVPNTSIAHGMTGVVAADDGTVWVSIGDDADYTQMTPNALRALDVNQYYGKILHLTATGAGVPGNPYYDAGNPGSARSKVFASGFRSPFRFSLDPSSGLPVLGDVGWNTYEEVDIVQPGRNYAWPCWEGFHRTPGYMDLAQCAGVQNQPPIWEYQHGSGSTQGNSVTAGFVYTGSSYPSQYKGMFFFGDYVTNKIWTMRYDSTGKLTQNPQDPPWATGIGGPVKFGAAPNGDVVYADILSGNIRRISYSQGNTAPVANATSTTDPNTRTVTFDASSSVDYDGDALTYSWDFGDGTTGTGVTTTHTYAAGTDRFTATLTARDPLGATGTTQLVVAPSNHSPVLTLTTPGDVKFAVGDPIHLGATATDAEDGTLDVAWTSIVLHCPEESTCHSHPGVGGTGPAFDLDFTEHPDSRMRLTATVTDSAGVSTTKSYLAWPNQHKLTLTSNVPASLQIPSESGVSSAMVTQGLTLDVVASQLASDGASTFASWADSPSAPRSRSLAMPGSDLTLTANYTSPIDQRYASDTALRQWIGTPTGAEVADGGVHYRDYQNGRLYWSQDTGVHEVHGLILQKYLELGGHGRLGAPVTDETGTPDGVGRFNHFVGTPGTLTASVYFTPNTGAHAVWGVIRQKWEQLNWEKGPLGYPVTDELTTPDGVGRYNHFDKASSIYWTPANGAHGVWGAIRQVWQQLGWETGPMGYPVTDELTTPDGVGRYNHFDKASSIYWTPGTGAHEVYGAIRARWAALGWERSYLGYPRSGEFTFDGGRRNDFVYGFIQWYPDGRVIDGRW
ncbi:PKD domain-containing protein [Amycolatopsis sp. K13G38]|uniref:PKD domain-containing protein n=1 Tax=Amycolatopsis acididurans TaxID=2724524 RepID=A0ABX1J6H1_9PSEU|nr:PQQ-dependent sugar dehydrogenase [Amycolatopsis acididurans]NKQ55259.1 PKD domain-containing protein [Amycolatopsis acididurans]